MSCGHLPGTGGPAVWFLVLAAVCLVTGWLLLRRRRGRRADSLAVTLIVLIGVGLGVATQSSGYAATSGCADGNGVDRSLTITQTSLIADLRPGVPPTAVRGRVTNLSLDSTFVSTVTVSIASVTKATGATVGVCSAADYVLTGPRMVVDRPLAMLSRVPFSGAVIGFSNSSANQDACKGATIHLAYVSDSR